MRPDLAGLEQQKSGLQQESMKMKALKESGKRI